jgi:hypothetical protein
VAHAHDMKRIERDLGLRNALADRLLTDQIGLLRERASCTIDSSAGRGTTIRPRALSRPLPDSSRSLGPTSGITSTALHAR